MDEQQIQQQIALLIQAAMSGDQQAQQQIDQIMSAAQQGDQQALQLAQMIQSVAKQMQLQQAQMAKNGAKLNYIRQLKGVCPDGYEMQYFANGGKTCKKCVAKQQKMEEGGEVPSNPVDAFKCGRKMNKKKVKKASGGEKVTVVNTPKGKYKEYDRGEYYDYVTPTDSVSENIDGRDNEAVKRLNKAGLEFYEAKEKYGVQKENNKVSKHQEGNLLTYEYNEWDDPYGLNRNITSETLVSLDGSYKGIGDRRVYRWIYPQDTTFVVYPNRGYYGRDLDGNSTINPIAVYTKNSPGNNYKNLNKLFDQLKRLNNNKR